MLVRCFNIDYDVSDEDLEFIEESREEILERLPKEIEIEVDDKDADSPDSDEILANAISDQTKWLVNGFNYEEIG